MAGEIVLGYDDTEEARAALPVAVRLARSLDAGLELTRHLGHGLV